MAELASCTIYIKGIATTATEADVRDACSQYGNITDVAIPEGKDFCFVEFAEEAQAQAAAETGGFDVCGAHATVEMRKPRRGRRERATVPEGTSTSIYIPGLPDSADKEAIRNLFAGLFEAQRVDLRQRQDGSRYAFVEFGDCTHVQEIMASGPFTLDDQTLELEERTSVARVRAPRKQNEGVGEANGGGRTRNRGRRGGGGGGGEGGEYGGGENGEEGGEGRGRRVPPVAENSVYIKGFPDTTTEDDIRAEFSQYGDITSVILRVKHIGEDIRTWAFVEYGAPEMVEPAIAGSESLELGGVPCTVEARKSTPTPRSEYGGGGRNRRYGGRRPRGDRGDRKREEY
ncbi:unnamed protein product [Ectocarpus sp. 12 AP-2014]